MLNNQSFVLYESVYKQMSLLKTKLGIEIAFDFINAIIEFGLYGIEPDKDSDVWMYGFEQSITSISSAKERYQKSIENGKKGGAPKRYDRHVVAKLRAENYTNKEIAEKLGCHTKTVGRIFKELDKESETNEDITDITEQNLNKNINVNFKETEKLKENETVSEVSPTKNIIFEEYL